MFDWDKDYDGLISSTSVDVRPNMAHDTSDRRFLKALSLAAALIFAGIAGHALSTRNTETSDLSQMRFLELASVSQIVFLGDLQIFDDGQRDRFQDGLRAFSQTDLARYASTTRTDLEMAAIFMQPYLADALALIAHELARRGT